MGFSRNFRLKPSRAPSIMALGFLFIAFGPSGDLFAAPILGGLNGVPSTYSITFTLGGQTETVIFTTTRRSLVERGDQVGSTIQLEVLSAEAIGTNPNFGDMILRAGRLNGVEPTLGELTNITQAPDPRTHGGQSSLTGADQSLDVYFEIELLDMGMTVTNAPLPQFAISGTPVVTAGPITALPPSAGTTYTSGTQSIPLHNVATGAAVNAADDDIACDNVVSDGASSVIDNYSLPAGPRMDDVFFTVRDTITVPGLGTDTVEMTGSIWVQLDAPTDSEWGTGTIAAHMMSLNVEGTSALFGTVRASLNNAQGQTLGTIAAAAGPTGVAVCAVNAFIKLELPDQGLTLFNKVPVPLMTDILRVPPIGHQGGAESLNIELFDVGDPNGPFLATLLEVEDQVGDYRIVSPVPTTSEWGLIIMAVLVLTAGTVMLRWRLRAAAA